MTLYLRRGARVRRLHIVRVPDGFYARWGKHHARFDAEGEVQDVVAAAVAALENREVA